MRQKLAAGSNLVPQLLQCFASSCGELGLSPTGSIASPAAAMVSGIMLSSDPNGSGPYLLSPWLPPRMVNISSTMLPKGTMDNSSHHADRPVSCMRLTRTAIDGTNMAKINMIQRIGFMNNKTSQAIAVNSVNHQYSDLQARPLNTKYCLKTEEIDCPKFIWLVP